MRLSLCNWKLAIDAENVGRQSEWFNSIRSDAQDAPVPGIMQQVFPNCWGVAWYWCEFMPNAVANENQRCVIQFAAVDYMCDVWLNGQHVGAHEGGETPFEVDVTKAAAADGENLLAVRVLCPADEPIDGVTLAEIPRRNRKAGNYTPGASLNTGGIFGEVEFKVVPAVRIVDVFANPQTTDGSISVQVTVRNDSGSQAWGELLAEVEPANCADVQDSAAGDVVLPAGDSTHELTLLVEDFRLWDIDDPFLYRVNTSLVAGGGVWAHRHTVRCGFRDFCLERGFFRLNGRRVFLKCSHTGNHFPESVIIPADPALMRRDFVMMKACGYNSVRLIAGMALPEQLDLCDEIGLMVYEECLAAWLLGDSPQMAERFDNSTRDMVLRDRNHPSVTIWGLINEMEDGPVFRQAVAALPMVRDLDESRLVLLASGRWDHDWSIGSAANPGSREWQYVWGAEGPDAEEIMAGMDMSHQDKNATGGVFQFGSGDAHVYPGSPMPKESERFVRTMGAGGKPVFLSEFGAGSMLDVIRGARRFKQDGARDDLADVALFRQMADRFEADWKRWGFDEVYPFAEDLIAASQEMQTRQRARQFNMVRSNPDICGYNLTGLLDHGITGEGGWTFWRQWKPQSAEMFEQGWAPLKWCLFVDSMNGYRGDEFTVEAVLANEDVLGPGDYPVSLCVSGADGVVWRKSVTVSIPEVAAADNPQPLPADFEDTLAAIGY